MNTGSANIPVFEVKTLVDLTAKPKLVIINHSTGAQVGAKFTFELYSPLSIPIHIGNFTTPDVVTPFTTFEITELPAYKNQIEFGEYKLIASVRDGSNTHVITRTINLRRPAGNSVDAVNNYGKAYLDFEVRCNNGKVFAEDRTPNSYGGVTGTLVSRKLQFTNPPDGTGVIPLPKNTSLQNSTFDLPYNGEGFNLFLEVVYDYLFLDYVTIRVKYKANECFAVNCGIDLCKILCAIDEFREEVACDGDAAKYRKLVNANTLLTQVLVAKAQPNCGVDVEYLLNKLATLLNVDCSCSNSSGIGSDRDSIKNLAIQIYNITNIDNEVKNYYCAIGCDCVDMIGLTGEAHAGGSTTVTPTTSAATTTIPTTTTNVTTSTVPATTSLSIITTGSDTTVPATTTAPINTTLTPTTVPATTTIPATTTVDLCRAYKISLAANQTGGVANTTDCITNELVSDTLDPYYSPIDRCSKIYPSGNGAVINVIDLGLCSDNQRVVIWGVSPTRTMPTIEQIMAAASTHSALVSAEASQITANFTYNNTPGYHWISESVSEPQKNIWDWDGPNQFDNEGNIGGPVSTTENAFPDPVTVSTFRVYMTVGATLNTQFPLTLKVNNL